MASVHTKVLDIQTLDTRPSYQRPLDEARVLRMATSFDPHMVGVPEVHGVNVLDGQHRVEAAKVHGIRRLMCRVHEGLTFEEEVHLYRRLNSERKALRPIEDFRAALQQKDPDALALDEAVRASGFEITDSNKTTGIGAVRMLQAMYRRSESTLRESLNLVRVLVDMTDSPISGEIFSGVQIFLLEHGAAVDRKRLSAVLAKHSPQWWRAASDSNVASDRRAARMAALIEREYNKRLAAVKQVHCDLY